MKLKRLLAVSMVVTLGLSCTAFAGVAVNIPKGGTVAIEQEKTEEEAPVIVLTYEEAVEMAIKNNSSIKQLVESLDDIEDTRQMVGDALYLQTIPGFATETTTYLDSDTANLLTTLNSLETNIKTVRYTEEILKNTCELMVKNYMTEIIKAENNVAMMETNLEMSRTTTYFNRIKYDLGMISLTELNKAINDNKTTEHTFELTKLARETAYNSLSRLVGFDHGEKYVIEYAPQYEIYPVQNNMDSFVSRKINTDPSLKIVEGQISDAEFGMKFAAIDNSPSYEERKEKVEQAGRNYNDKKNDLVLAIKNGYAAVKQAEGNIETLKLTLANTQKQYDNAVISRELGYITDVELMGAKLALTKAENDVEAAIMSHDLAKFMLDHPYLSAGSASSADSASSAAAQQK